MANDPEELLWELSSLGEDEDVPIPDDQALQDFREGRLAAGQAEQIRRLLARSRQARLRLGELAGLAPLRPTPELRSRVLASLPVRRRGRFGWQRAVLAVAAMALMILAARVFWLDSPWPSVGPLPEYQIRVFATAEVRNPDGNSPQPDADRVYRFDPRTPVRIQLSAREAASDQVSYGLYQLREGRLSRLKQAQGVTLEESRGVAVFEIIGTRLAPQVDRWQLFALVASPGRLPDGVSLREGENPQAALGKASGGRVFSVRLEMSPEGGSGKSKGKEEE